MASFDYKCGDCSYDYLTVPKEFQDKITACENDGQLKAFSPHEAKQRIHEWLGHYNVEVNIGQESARSAYSKYDAKETFTTHTETMWQRLVASYYEEGLLTAIRQLSQEESSGSIAKKCASVLLKLVHSLNKLKMILPIPSRSGSLLNISQVLQDCSRSIVGISWHPHTSTMAAAFGDDTVRVFGKGRSLNPVLKHRLQKKITALEWMPYCASLLAVGCESGVLLWTLDPISVVSRPSGSCLSQLSHPDALPLSSFSWHPKGLSLACVGGKGRSLIMWDVGMEEHCTLYTGLATSFTMIKFCPTGKRLLATMANAAIKVFECHSWTYERWSLAHPLQSAVWSSCGRFLLFVTTKEPLLFCLSFRDEDGGVGGALVASQMADLSASVVTCEDGTDTSVGGLVKELAWDEKSERLAVLFKDSKYIALFHTFIHPSLHLAPGGFIRGSSGKIPLKISFQNNVSNGSILTVIWSGGEVEHLPLQYTSHEAHSPLTSSPYQLPKYPTNAFSTPTALNHSRAMNLSLGPTSPIGSPLPRLFTSP